MSRIRISDAAYETLQGWCGPVPVASLMGEFSAGKSTLLNLLLDHEAAPTKVTATHLPPIWFTHSDTSSCFGVTWDGEVHSVDLTCPETDFRGDYLMLRMGIDAEILKQVELIDAPGISDPGLRKDALRFLSRYMDFAIWCTAANQAWRQTEKAAFEKLSKAIQAHSVLIITRMDKLRYEKDQAKVLKRVQNDAGDLFSRVIPLQTPKAASVPKEARTEDAAGLWVQSGGAGLFDALEASAAAFAGRVRKARRDKPVAPPKPVENAISAPKSPQSDNQKEHNPLSLNSIVAEAKTTFAEFKSMPANGQYCQTIDHLIASIECQLSQSGQNKAALAHCLRIERDDMEIDRLVSQIERELSVFGTESHFRLDA
ncbi:MAG: hypothetical protein AAF943_01515 [Pseudomonadota bacterium]